MSAKTARRAAQSAASENLAAVERGETLPARWYTDAAVFAAERERIFRRCWQYVGLTEQVARPGDFFTATVGEAPVVVVRDEGGVLRAYANVCRHRGSTLVLAECGQRKTLQCHYHAWTYNLDGSLRAAPGMKDEPDFDPAAFSLVPLPVEAWGPFIFLNPDRMASPLNSVLGELPALVAATGLDLGGIRRRVHRTYEIAANWKVVLDNYLECYHCPVAHPGFCDLIDVNDYVVTEYEHFSTQHGALTTSAAEGRADGLYDTRGGVREGFYAYLWPNFTLNIYPGPGNVSLNLFLPLAVDRTLAIYDYCFADAVGIEEERDFVRFIDQVQEEDIVLCESVQRGLSSGYFDRGKLMLTRERALRHFQRLVCEHLAQ
ncbi:MAG TPA: aromatic ring-hydroxylating dioxygenase subunit alpha [Ktedonobacterales bacterium]|nr:aromatic ring-hydroxylating dioxygenase subunit alpha [Ktedonobacterales bacterium]